MTPGKACGRSVKRVGTPGPDLEGAFSRDDRAVSARPRLALDLLHALRDAILRRRPAEVLEVARVLDEVLGGRGLHAHAGGEVQREAIQPVGALERLDPRLCVVDHGRAILRPASAGAQSSEFCRIFAGVLVVWAAL